MRVITNYVAGQLKTEIYVLGNDIYYDGTIYKFPGGSFDWFYINDNNNKRSSLIFWDGELILSIFVDNPEDLEKTDWVFEEIPAGYYETCPIVEVPSNEAVVENDTEEI